MELPGFQNQGKVEQNQKLGAPVRAGPAEGEVQVGKSS